MTGCERILARLQDGPATAAELYALHAMVHSRVAELRKRGFQIACERLPGASGPHAYVYSLLASPGEWEAYRSEVSGSADAVTSSLSARGAQAVDGRVPDPENTQLSLEAA